MLDIVSVGVLVIFGGVMILIVSTVLSGGNEGSNFRSAAVVMLGPIPIIFGSDARWASVAVALAIALVLLSLVAYLA